MAEMMINIKFPGSSNPRGIRLISIPSSSFTAYVIPRKLTKDVQQINGIDNPGIYFLMTQRADGFYIYAGQARNGIKRLNNHNVSKEFWDNAIITITIHAISKTELSQLFKFLKICETSFLNYIPRFLLFFLM